MLAMEFLVRGIPQYGEPGVFVAFEETPEDLAKNVASLGFDLEELEAEGKLVVEFIRVEKAEMKVSGAYTAERGDGALPRKHHPGFRDGR